MNNKETARLIAVRLFAEQMNLGEPLLAAPCTVNELMGPILSELNQRHPHDEGVELETRALDLVGKYRALLMMAPPVKAFFKRLAVFLKWQELEKAL